jgi:hypothetical protein
VRTVLFNPYTGAPRHPSDIQSDPEGILIMEPGAQLLAARQYAQSDGEPAAREKALADRLTAAIRELNAIKAALPADALGQALNAYQARTGLHGSSCYKAFEEGWKAAVAELGRA